jgi:branched-chain amino acid transport system substrate-binding protein
MKKRIILVVLLVSIFVCCGVVSVFRGEAQAGPPSEIVVNLIGDITGPYAPSTGAACLFAIKDMEKYINSHGGVRGVKIRFVVHDTRNKRDVAISKYAEISAQKPPLIVVLQVADVEVLKERLAEDKIPALGVGGTDKTNWPVGWVFQTTPAYNDQFALFLDWLRSDWKKTGRIKLALVCPDFPYGHSIFTPTVDDYIKKKDIDVVAKEFFPPFDLDATTQFGRVARSKPDVIYSMTIAGQVRVALKGAESAGLIESVLYGMGCWGIDRTTAKLTGGLMEGVVGVAPVWLPSETHIPMIKELVDNFEKEKRPPENNNGPYAIHCIVKVIAAEALSKTVERVGWDKLNGEEVYKTLVGTKEWKVLGVMPFQFGTNSRCSLFGRMVKIKSGEPVPISSWLPCPDMRPVQFR